jgi:hypothetical protein
MGSMRHLTSGVRRNVRRGKEKKPKTINQERIREVSNEHKRRKGMKAELRGAYKVK